jgi:4a-hydroxytetrahydrobiopterin dehydratase
MLPPTIAWTQPRSLPADAFDHPSLGHLASFRTWIVRDAEYAPRHVASAPNEPSRMNEQITARQFHLSEGVADWRVANGGACAYFRANSFTAGTRFVQAISELPGIADHAPDVDLRPDGVFVRLFTTAPAPDGLGTCDVEMARLISSAAQQQGLTADASEVYGVVVVIDALDLATVVPFWRAVLGYGDRDDGPVEELTDPHRRGPVVCFQHLDAPRPQRNRIHLDVCVPHQEAETRVAAATAAGGRVVSDEMAPSWWVLADPEGNEACVATWIGTDGAGYP